MGKFLKWFFVILFTAGLTFLFTANSFAFWSFAAKSGSSKHIEIISGAAAKLGSYSAIQFEGTVKDAGGNGDTTVQLKWNGDTNGYDIVFEGKSSDVYVANGIIYFTETAVNKTVEDTHANRLIHLPLEVVQLETYIEVLKFGNASSLVETGDKLKSTPAFKFKPFYIGTTTTITKADSSITFGITLLSKLRTISISNKVGDDKTSASFKIKEISSSKFKLPNNLDTSWPPLI